MAIKSIEQLKAWFRKGLYPTESQFSDWFDSYRHKNDKVEINEVEGLPKALNAKYNATEAQILEQRQQTLDDKVAHVEIVQDSQAESIDRLKEKFRVVGELLKEDATLDEAREALIALGDNYNSLYNLALTIKTFLETTDTKDTTINTWVEVENFLQGVTDMSSLTALLKELESNITTAYTKAISEASPKDDIDTINAELVKARNLIKSDSSFEDSQTALLNLGNDYKNLYALASLVKSRFESSEDQVENYVENILLENGSEIDANNLSNEKLGATIFVCNGNSDGTTINFPEDAYLSSGDGFVVEFFNLGWGFFKQRLHRPNSYDTFARYTKPKGEWSEWKKIAISDEIPNVLSGAKLDASSANSISWTSIPTNTKIVVGNFNTDVTINLSGIIPAGENITIIMCNAATAAKTINFSNFGARNVDTLTVEPSKAAEINIAYDGVNLYLRAIQYFD